eukprot:1790809-Pyramimonas_sp.AAC.1
MRRHLGPGSLVSHGIFSTTTWTESPGTSGEIIIKAEKLGSSQSPPNTHGPSAQQRGSKPPFRFFEKGEEHPKELLGKEPSTFDSL